MKWAMACNFHSSKSHVYSATAMFRPILRTQAYEDSFSLLTQLAGKACGGLSMLSTTHNLGYQVDLSMARR